MELRLYCDDCGKELGFFTKVEEGQIVLEVISHECVAAQPAGQAHRSKKCAECGALGYSHFENCSKFGSVVVSTIG